MKRHGGRLEVYTLLEDRSLDIPVPEVDRVHGDVSDVFGLRSKSRYP